MGKIVFIYLYPFCWANIPAVVGMRCSRKQGLSETASNDEGERSSNHPSPMKEAGRYYL
jgi:hypothetical protein